MTFEGHLDEPVQLLETPEKTIPSLVDLYQKIGFILRPSKRDGISRTLDVRADRARLLRELRHAEKNDRQQIFDEVKLRDEIGQRSLIQGEVSVAFPDGPVKSTYMKIIPPEQIISERKTDHLPSIVFIPGISNDPECVAALARELAFQGRTVYVIGYPGSSVGTVTEGFTKAVEGEMNFETHTKFFEAALTQVLKNEQSIELWGDSTGCPIVCELLQKKAIAEKTKTAVLVCPASSIEQSVAELNKGIPGELRGMKGLLRNLPKYWYGVETSTGAQKELKKRIQTALMSQVAHQSHAWKQARVIEGGTITVVSGKNDRITKSSDVFNAKNETILQESNAQLRILELPGYSHFTPLINPRGMLETLNKFFSQ